MGIFSYVKAGKKAFEIVKPKIAKNLKQKFDAKQKLFKSVDEKGSNLSTVQKGKFKKEGSQEIDKIFKKYEKKAKGGRVGRKFGNPKPKTDVEKIKKAFDPRKSDLNKDGRLTSYEKKRGMAIAKAMRGRNKNV